MDDTDVKILQAENLPNWRMLVVDPEKTQTRWPGEASIEQVPNWRALGE